VSIEAPAPLVGRDGDLVRLRRLLGEHRLVTLTGPGGVGKTALALAAVQRLGLPARVRVGLCELADVESLDAVRHAVAASLRIVARAGAPIGESIPAVDDSSLLVLLDNCEHVLPAAADIAYDLLSLRHYSA
jgi:predicted ATPase